MARARDRARSLSAAEVADALADGAVTLVDLREPDEVRRSGSLPNAVLAPRGMLESLADPDSPYHRPEFVRSARTILCCASGGRSALARRPFRNPATPTSGTWTAAPPRGSSRADR